MYSLYKEESKREKEPFTTPSKKEKKGDLDSLLKNPASVLEELDDSSVNQKPIDLKEMKAQGMNRRVQQWASQYMSNPALQEALKKGSIPLLHPDLHTFRNQDPTAYQRISSRIFIPGKTYEPELLRILASEKSAREAILERDCYRKEEFEFKTKQPQKELHKPIK
jgi:hypothetical protein